MSDYLTKIAELTDALPVHEQKLVYEIVKRFVLAWDPDFSKLSKTEAKRLDEAKKGGYKPL